MILILSTFLHRLCFFSPLLFLTAFLWTYSDPPCFHNHSASTGKRCPEDRDRKPFLPPREHPHAQVMPWDTQTLPALLWLLRSLPYPAHTQFINISPIMQLLFSKHRPFKRLLHVCIRKITRQKAAKRNFQLSTLCKSSAVSKQAWCITFLLVFLVMDVCSQHFVHKPLQWL